MKKFTQASYAREWEVSQREIKQDKQKCNRYGNVQAGKENTMLEDTPCYAAGSLQIMLFRKDY